MTGAKAFHNILDKYRSISFSERDKGDRFERLMQAYLQTDPFYAYRFKKVWLWNEFPCRKDFGGSDIGIDLVAMTHEGDYWAIQCKCFQQNNTIDKASVDSFLSTSGRKFTDVETLKSVSFAHRLWISTTNKWGGNALETLNNQSPAISRLNLSNLEEAPVDWEKLEKGLVGELSRTEKKSLRAHQKEALELTHEYFKSADRGKLVMACGTGKTFTSLRIAENESGGKGLVLFLVPSIALLGQTLREWSADAAEEINAICICSDPKISKKTNKNEDIDSFSVVDLALPASTDVPKIVQQLKQLRELKRGGMTIVFSTYQSIEVIAAAQKALLESNSKGDNYGIFDLIICDEAHRTTGVALTEEDSSAFIKVHNNEFLQAKKRLYMTATPRLFNDESKSKAAKESAILCSMDDVSLYGDEIYRIGFGEAVQQGLLTDYKVLVLTLNEADVPEAIQKMVANKESEINSDDASKLIGCINALSKQILGDEGIIKDTDPDPMRRAVAFCQNIAISKKISNSFNNTSEAYLDALPRSKKEKMVAPNSRHIDGAMSAPTRDELLSWLKGDIEGNECRILTNVRCLSEGVDVPSLDAVLFLSARNSQVDVVQSVGRVMRKSPGKKYGYIIIPVVIPSNVEPEKAMEDNERFRVVWTVLNALRAHDDRFNAIVNKIELNKDKSGGQIIVGGAGGRTDDTEYSGVEDPEAEYNKKTKTAIKTQMMLQFEQLQNALFARMVQKVGDRRYWEQWAKDVAEIAERHILRIKGLIANDSTHRQAFSDFLNGLQKNINPSISESEAVEMLAQHIITKPVFEALFEGYSFVKNNPISRSMQEMLDLLEEQSLEKDAEILQKFYESVRTRAAGIDNAQGKQRIIIELYDKFFKTAFPKMVEKLGIVYTPVEVVDFIIHSVDELLKKEFGRCISDENVHILDPFTGTGTFMVRLLQSGLIRREDLSRKYRSELHANEIVLLAYYIAAINMENTFHDLSQAEHYEPFEGICLTDTFQLSESDANEKLFSKMFPQNSERVLKQKKAPIRIIMGNPPYSVGQKSANDNAQNQEYPILNSRIAATYVKESNAGLKTSLYDSYIKAFRWASDRLDKETGGIISFVSNGGWLDGNATEGFRKSLEKEFDSIYVFNLRGNARSSGEMRRKEAGNVFSEGSRTPVSITFLIKNPKAKSEKAKIYYHDIGDYLNREEKLAIIQKFGNVVQTKMPWQQLQPNEHGDWLNQRNDSFDSFLPIIENDKSFFTFSSWGVKTNRDAWTYNSSKVNLLLKVESTINFYNGQREEFLEKRRNENDINVESFINTDPQKIS